MPAKTLLDPLTEARNQLATLQADHDTIDDQIEAAEQAEDISAWLRLRNRKAALPDLVRHARLAVLPLELAAAWSAAEDCNEHEVRLAAELVERQSELTAAREHATKIAFTAAPAERAEHGVVAQYAQDAERAADRDHEDARDATCVALHHVEQVEAEIALLTGEAPEAADGFRARPKPATGNYNLRVHDLGPLADLLDETSAMPPATMWFGGDREWHLRAGAVPPRSVAHRMGHSHHDPRPDGPSEHELSIQRRHAEHMEKLLAEPAPSNGWVSREAKEMSR